MLEQADTLHELMQPREDEVDFFIKAAQVGQDRFSGASLIAADQGMYS
jgi:hypothetical protein